MALIFGVQGACRREELCNILTTDIHDTGHFYVIKLPYTKTKIERSFVIEGKLYEIVKKYADLRPKDVPNNRFFVNYQNKKCTKQVIGLNKFGSMPMKIAEYLKLAEPKLYTGHCFRRTSATVLADSGADLTTLKRHGGWKSNQVAEGYIEDSVENKRRIGKRISDSILNSKNLDVTSKQPRMNEHRDAMDVKQSTSVPPCSTVTQEDSPSTMDSLFKDSFEKMPPIKMQNCTNFTINLYQNKN